MEQNPNEKKLFCLFVGVFILVFGLLLWEGLEKELRKENYDALYDIEKTYIEDFSNVKKLENASVEVTKDKIVIQLEDQKENIGIKTTLDKEGNYIDTKPYSNKVGVPMFILGAIVRAVFLAVAVVVVTQIIIKAAKKKDN